MLTRRIINPSLPHTNEHKAFARDTKRLKVVTKPKIVKKKKLDPSDINAFLALSKERDKQEIEFIGKTILNPRSPAISHQTRDRDLRPNWTTAPS